LDHEKLKRLLTSQGTVTVNGITYAMIPEVWLASALGEIPTSTPPAPPVCNACGRPKTLTPDGRYVCFNDQFQGCR
jgi:hypothetical protein